MSRAKSSYPAIFGLHDRFETWREFELTISYDYLPGTSGFFNPRTGDAEPPTGPQATITEVTLGLGDGETIALPLNRMPQEFIEELEEAAIADAEWLGALGPEED